LCTRCIAQRSRRWNNCLLHRGCRKDARAFQSRGKPTLKTGRESLRKWFRKNGGKNPKVVTKPLLTPDRKFNRAKWAEARKRQLDSGEPFHAAFLDEKRFCTMSRCKRIKYLPKESTRKLVLINCQFREQKVGAIHKGESSSRCSCNAGNKATHRSFCCYFSIL